MLSLVAIIIISLFINIFQGIKIFFFIDSNSLRDGMVLLSVPLLVALWASILSWEIVYGVVLVVLWPQS
jgi:hypothetical protein